MRPAALLLALALASCGPSASDIRDQAAPILADYQKDTAELAEISIALISFGDPAALNSGGPAHREGLALGRRLAAQGGTPGELEAFKNAWVALKKDLVHLRSVYQGYASKALLVKSLGGALEHYGCGGAVTRSDAGFRCAACKAERPDVKVVIRKD